MAFANKLHGLIRSGAIRSYSAIAERVLASASRSS
jgi:hypothetical protein